jgi:hypothetical protein
MKWKVQGPDGVQYLDPEKVTLELTNCQLKNGRSTALKIYQGAHKTVCAWVLCESIVIKDSTPMDVERMTQLKYNPRVLPYWTHDGVNADGSLYDTITSNGRSLFTPKKKQHAELV